MTADVRDYLFGYPMFGRIPEPRLSPLLDVQSRAINTVGPVISGTTEVGQTLTCDPGTWAFSPTGYRYQWLRAGAAIPSATASTHVITESDTGNILRCAVVAENSQGLSDPAVSNGLFIPALDTPVNVTPPIISGVTTVGQTLSCTTGTWDNDPTSYAYSWKRNGVAIDTGSTHLLVALDEGTNITCAVTATNINGSSVPVTSNTLAIPVSGEEPVLVFTGTTTFAEDVALATVVGTWSVTNPNGTYTYTITEDTNDNFVLVDDELQIDQALNYEAGASLTVTVEADNGVDPVLSEDIIITVTNVLEVTLAALTLSADEIEDASPEDTVVGTLSGKTSGSTLSLTDSAGSRFKLTGLNIVAGSVPTDFATSTTHSITVREVHADATNTPRDTIFTINVTEIVVITATYLLVGSQVPGVVARGGSRDMIVLSGMVSEG